MDEQHSRSSLMVRLADARSDLRPSERRVADVVLDRPHGVAGLSMAAVANLCGVSEPTVMRFCTAVGYSGFRAFMAALDQSLAIGLPVSHSAVSVDDSVGDMAMKIFGHTLSSLDHARSAIDVDKLEASVDLVVGASDALFVGLGSSGLVAQDALNQAPLFGLPVAAPIDSHQQFMAASTMAASGVVIAISNTGRSESVLRVVEAAHARGASTIGIVGGASPLSEMVDVDLVARTFEDTDIYTPTVSRLAGLVMIDVLATCVAIRRGPGHLEALRDMKRGLSDFRGSSTGRTGA